jgi:hypothetical protein
MPVGRPVVDLEPLKEQILSLFHSGYTHQEIALEVHAKERTISRRLQAWGIRKRAPYVKTEDKMMRAQVAIYFAGNLTDDEIAFALQQQGWRVHKRTVARIRISQGIRRRFSAFQRQVAVETLWKIIEQELDNGSIEGYSRRLLQVHFKRLGHHLS